MANFIVETIFLLPSARICRHIWPECPFSFMVKQRRAAAAEEQKRAHTEEFVSLSIFSCLCSWCIWTTKNAIYSCFCQARGISSWKLGLNCTSFFKKYGSRNLSLQSEQKILCRIVRAAKKWRLAKRNKFMDLDWEIRKKRNTFAFFCFAKRGMITAPSFS